MQAENPPRVMMTFLRLILNYQYGLDVLSVEKLTDVAPLQLEHGDSIRAIYLIQDAELTTRNPINLLTRRMSVPLFLLLPPDLAEVHQNMARTSPNLYVCSWDKAFAPDDTAMQQIMARVFPEQGLGQIHIDQESTSHDELQARIERRLKHLKTFPTLPEVVMRITTMVNQPDTDIEELAQVIMGDPAIVHKLIQVVHSSSFTGAGQKNELSLHDAIVRMGFKQVGAIAQQVKLINSLIRPPVSPFDLRRHWEHSVGTAVIADKIYKQKLIELPEIDFDLYWLSALLHDIGRLVLGFFFWDYFESVRDRMLNSNRISFRRAEARLGDVVNHEYLGQLLMLNAKAQPEVVDAVANHHSASGMPKPLVCLVHMADNFTKHLGMG